MVSALCVRVCVCARVCVRSQTNRGFSFLSFSLQKIQEKLFRIVRETRRMFQHRLPLEFSLLRTFIILTFASFAWFCAFNLV